MTNEVFSQDRSRRLYERRRELDEAEDKYLAPAAARSRDAVRRRPDTRAEAGHRQYFAIDADRILHSMAYTRYIDKTQVFSLIKNDQITHRVLHVQLVSKIARTIGRLLGANQDLIEAIALGHDIGHPPFGHDGEDFLDTLCQENGLGHFVHSVQSVRFLEKIERGGEGWNLSLQVLDGILCHDGEVHAQGLAPEQGKDFARFDRETRAKQRDPSEQLAPMTLEGCIVRQADTISYVGRDIEDAVRLGLLSWEDVPRKCTAVLGVGNGTIVYRLVEDLVAESHGASGVAFSPEVSAALARLKAFNYERIYTNPQIKPHLLQAENMFRTLFGKFLEDVGAGREGSPVFVDFLADMSEEYRKNNSAAEQVRDFVAGLTDERFLELFTEMVLPRGLPRRLS
ncbi:MAG: HD domain-containing protein [Proteobacteria bacterium]|nr:HD domain-containing protein [Pseudomonadota bacterium]MBU1742290.1 HD domain-containing protein [Pseudomonadota bacterium]